MNYQGSIKLNYQNDYAFKQLFKAVLNRLANHQTKLAIWLISEIDLSLLNTQRIGVQSPFKESNSELDGLGFVIEVEPSTVENIIQVLAVEDYLRYEILHLEIKAYGSIQFSAYDHFEHVFFGNEIDLKLLEDLKIHEIIDDYQIFEKES